jgi:hypothetical protein
LTKPVPKIYTTRFFQLITSRQFAEAERILERVKQRMHESGRNRGYFQALYGMLLTMKNNDRYAFLSSADFTDKKNLKNFRREFLSHMESRLHDEYDRGYFEAWSDYMKILPRIETPPSFNNSKNHVKQPPEETETQDETAEAKEPVDESKAADGEEPTVGKTQEQKAKPAQSLLLDYAK